MKTHFILPSILGIALGLASGLAFAADAPPENPPAETNWLSSLKLSGIEQVWGEAHSNRSVDNQRLTIAGRVFERGIGTHANSSIPLELDVGLVRHGNPDSAPDGKIEKIFSIFVNAIRCPHIERGATKPRNIGLVQYDSVIRPIR